MRHDNHCVRVDLADQTWLEARFTTCPEVHLHTPFAVSGVRLPTVQPRLDPVTVLRFMPSVAKLRNADDALNRLAAKAHAAWTPELLGP